MKKYFRWPTGVILAVFVLVALLPTFSQFHLARYTAAFAAKSNSSPSITLSATIVHPDQILTVTGQGFAPGDIVSILFNYSSIGTIPCDGNGNCAGTVTVPKYAEPQGQYQVLGDGTSGLITTNALTVTLLPRLYLQLLAGGPGTFVVVDGSGFMVNETLKIYWGKTNNSSFEGTTITDPYGNISYFSFNVPQGVTPGNYPIIVARSHQTPARVMIRFNVLAPKLTSTSGIRIDQPVHVKLSGFQANELVNLSWNANNGQTITTLTMDSTGAVDTYTAVPFAPKGSYTLTARGNLSGLTASSSLNIGPGILLTPNTANAGGSIIVNGGGFVTGETVNVFFQNKHNGVITTTVDPAGSFSVSLTIPVHHSLTASYYVYAVSTSSKDNAKAQFFYMMPSLSIPLYSVYYNNPFTISGQGFTAHEMVTLTWQYSGEPQPVTLGIVQAASDGTFTAIFSAPAAPYAQIVTITGTGRISKLPTTTTTEEANSIAVTPLYGPVGTTVQVTGSGYGSTESVIATLQGTQVATFTTDINGLFTGTFVVPGSASQGNNTLELYGSLSSALASVTFLVTPVLTITPTTGPSGTVITVNGSSFPASSLIQINWEDPSTGLQSYLTLVNTNSIGTFTTTVTAPANLFSGHTYYVTTVSPVALATFIAQ